jgi:uncharacterized repeat protein (TIGR02543 family)
MSYAGEGGSSVETFTVTFVTNNDTEIPQQDVECGKKATRPADPTLDGFSFVHWYVEGTPNTPYDFNTPVTSNINLYAKWEFIDIPNLNSIAELAEWLAEKPANSSTTAYTVKLNVNSLGGPADETGSLGNTLLNNNTKYVKLDLSGSSFVEIPEKAFLIETSDATITPCQTLVEIIMPNSVTTIGAYAFVACFNLTSVTIGSGVNKIGDDSFTFCRNLTTINVATENTKYSAEGGILYNKNKTTLVAYPSAKGFVNIPNGVTTIGVRAFYNCLITNVTIPNSVTSIEESAFIGCLNLTSVTFTATSQVKSIGERAFIFCEKLTGITIPDSVESIGNNAFDSCTNLASVTIGSGVETIGLATFADCTNLTSVTIPDNVKSIELYAFSNCTNLTSVTIGSGVENIGSRAFSNCTNLTSVTFKGIIPSSGFDFYAFDELGNLRDKFYATDTTNGTPGTYTTTAPVSDSSVWTLKMYTLGETGPGGGKIFYVDAVGFTVSGYGTPGDEGYFASYTAHYLEAAPEDASTTGLAWSYISNSTTSTEMAIGTGRKNTAIILAKDTTAAPAAKACDVYSNGSKTDWFLPSKDELNELYTNKDSVGNMIDNDYYWSSSEFESYSNYAYGQFFDYSGSQNEISKETSKYVRAIRAF